MASALFDSLLGLETPKIAETARPMAIKIFIRCQVIYGGTKSKKFWHNSSGLYYGSTKTKNFK